MLGRETQRTVGPLVLCLLFLTVLATYAAAPAKAGLVAPPSRDSGSTVARIAVPTVARARPGGGAVVAPVRGETSWSRQPELLLVLGSKTVSGREWLRVLLPIRPVGASGWIRRDLVVLVHNYTWIELHKRSRSVVAYRHGRRVLRVRAVVGAAATPTPSGIAAVYERNRQPDPRAFYGPWILSLTALSNVIHRFDGGPGRIAIHGRSAAARTDPLGSARSHGCFRVDNGAIRRLVALAPPGTPVRIGR